MNTFTASDSPPGASQTGVLYIVATPIGNLEDITLRALRILGEVDLIAAEDTRHTRKLLSHYSISTPLTSYFKDKEQAKSEKIITALLEGRNVALVSDAGTPGISDPGAILVNQARSSAIQVIPIPGPSALSATLSVAGCTGKGFLFLGFLPAKGSERRSLLTSCSHEPRDLVFYESPRRLRATIQDCLPIFGNRRIFWARELTKIYEELQATDLESLLQELDGREIKGESVCVLSGAAKEEKTSPADLTEALRWHRNRDLRLKEAVQLVSNTLGVSRSLVYKEALRVWEEG